MGTRVLDAYNADKYPAQLSGGQRQRAAIAKQLLCSDQLLLMDEPFSGLDLLALERVARFIRDIAKTDALRTLVLVVHDLTVALSICDVILRVAICQEPRTRHAFLTQGIVSGR